MTLVEKPGSVAMVEYVRQFDYGYSDYDKERHDWLERIDIEAIAKHRRSFSDPVSILGIPADNLMFFFSRRIPRPRFY